MSIHRPSSELSLALSRRVARAGGSWRFRSSARNSCRTAVVKDCLVGKRRRSIPRLNPHSLYTDATVNLRPSLSNRERAAAIAVAHVAAWSTVSYPLDRGQGVPFRPLIFDDRIVN